MVYTAKKKKKLDILKIHSSDNVAELLSNEQVDRIGSLVCEHYDLDKTSIGPDIERLKKVMEVVNQTMTIKNTPWEGASNVKYPLATTAIIQYAARAYPEIIRSDKVVLTKILGEDPTGQKELIGDMIEDHMNYQLLVEDPEWEQELDKLLPCLAAAGTVYKKTYWDECEKRNRSVLCAPFDIIVNKYTKSLETTRRITHVIPMYLNEIISKIRYGLYCDEEESLRHEFGDTEKNLDLMKEQQEVLEQHCYLDLDDDGYEEPYIVTVHYKTKKVLRIYARFDLQDIKMNSDGKIWKIEPVHYFTAFHFIPSPDGSFLSLGYGHLLYPINEAVNTSLNQLIDAGTASNMQSGFLGRGFKSDSGDIHLTRGQWLKVDVAGDDLSKNIVPIPTKDPSQVLFKVVESMIQSGKEVASVTDVIQGQEQTQNSPATTVLALIEQSLKVYSAIQKRMFRSLRDEFSKLYRLNSIYLEQGYEYAKVGRTINISREVYTSNYVDVIPVSDPSMSSDAQRMARAKALLDIVPMVSHTGGQVIVKNWLEALKTPESEIQQIMKVDPSAPSPVQQQASNDSQELKMKQAQVMMENQLAAEKLHMQDMQFQSQKALNDQLIAESRARVLKMNADAVTAQEALRLDNEQAHVKLSIDAVKKMEDLKEQHQKELKAAAKAEMPPMPNTR